MQHSCSGYNALCRITSQTVKGSLRAPESGSLRAPCDHLEHQKSRSLREPENETFRVTLGDTGLGHGVGLGDQHGGMIPLGDTWGHGAGTWGGFRGPAWWNENFGVTLGDTWGDMGWV